MRGVLITFEGTEGAGKSTLIQALAALLARHGYPAVTTREPGGSAVAEKIRELILREPMEAWTEAFLYEAARAEHLGKTIVPELKRGAIVLCDRFTDSTLAYQGSARGLAWKTLRQLNKIATDGITPRLTVFVDIDPARGLRDAKDPNRFEAEGVSFQKKVRQGFLRAIREEPRRFITIRARSGTPEEMAADLYGKITKRLPTLAAKKPAPKKRAKK
jgi:dTMP kinase